MNVQSLNRPFSRIGRSVAVSLQADSTSQPTLDQLPDFAEVGRQVRHQQHRYGRPRLGDAQISAAGLSEFLIDQGAGIHSRGYQAQNKAQGFEAQVQRSQRARNLMGALSVGSLGLVPLGGLWSAIGLGSAALLGAGAWIAHESIEPAAVQARAYQQSAEEQFADAGQLQQLAQELQATRAQWVVEHQTQAPQGDEAIPDVEIETFEDAIIVGDHTLPVESW